MHELPHHADDRSTRPAATPAKLSDPCGTVRAMTTSMMGPLPAVSGCLCHICLPDPGSRRRLTGADRGCIETVVRVGWQVMLVGDGCSCAECGEQSDDDGPAFAYTVGLMHRAG